MIAVIIFLIILTKHLVEVSCLKLTMFQHGDEAEGSRLKWGPAAHDEHGLYPAHEPHPGEHPSYACKL